MKHDSFVNETDIINKKEVEKVVELLKNKNFVYEGKIEAPKSETILTGLKEINYYLNQAILEMIKIEHFKNQIKHGLILLAMLLIIITN